MSVCLGVACTPIWQAVDRIAAVQAAQMVGSVAREDCPVTLKVFSFNLVA